MTPEQFAAMPLRDLVARCTELSAMLCTTSGIVGAARDAAGDERNLIIAEFENRLGDLGADALMDTIEDEVTR